jgi:hypothetical protein
MLKRFFRWLFGADPPPRRRRPGVYLAGVTPMSLFDKSLIASGLYRDAQRRRKIERLD